MTVSVLVPTYKRPKALQRNLQSIISVGLNPLEVIVGDDSGDFETKTVCDEFCELLPIFRLAPNGKGSLATNITRLCNAAKGDWILLLHDDDFLVGNHSSFPMCFEKDYELFFTDHWIANNDGIIQKETSHKNSKYYGRNLLNEGLQTNNLNIGLQQHICLDGFYIRRDALGDIRPDQDLGQVADYFWILDILSNSIRVGYSSQRTFAYVISSDGLTMSGGRLNEDSVKGYNKMLMHLNDENMKQHFQEKISSNTWHAVNSCLKRGDRRTALLLLRTINFRYSHSIKHQLLIFIQLLLALIPIKVFRK